MEEENTRPIRRRNRSNDIEDKSDKRGDVLPAMPEGFAEFRLAKERTSNLNVEDEKPLSFQEETFIRSYFTNGFDHRDAAQRARIPYKHVAEIIRRPHVRRAMDRVQNELSQELKVDQARLIGDLYSMFCADLTDAVEHRRGACRYCWGKDGKYHWRTDRERDDLNSVPPGTRMRPTEDEPTRGQQDGGVGYDEYAAPNPECMECAGQGQSVVLIKDTAGKKAVQSVEYTPSGKISVKGYDKVKIGELLLRHLSMALNDEAHKIVNTGPTININGGIPPEFLAALKDKGGLAALEAFIEKDGAGRVAQLEAAATADEEAEIAEMIAKGENMD